MERKIGEIFEYNGEWYQCVEGNTCNDCAFYRSSCGSLNCKGSCRYNFREDATNVIFKKLEKIGKPYEHYEKFYQCYKLPMETEIRLLPNNCYPIGKDNLVEIEIKQKEDMEEKKIKLSQDDIDWLKKQIRWAALPGYITHEEDYDRATEEIMNLFIPSDTEHSSSEKIGKNLKPFDLEAAKAGKPVCTRDGRKARIICFDKVGDFPIVALTDDRYYKEEGVNLYDINGKGSNECFDLMMLPEKKEGWENVYKRENEYICENECNVFTGIAVYKSEGEAKRNIDKNEIYVNTIKITWEE